MYDQLYQAAKNIISRNNPKTVLADTFPGLSDGEPMLVTVKIGKGKDYIEISSTTAEAEMAFEWRVEITINTPHEYRHFLLLKDGSVVEAYGKQIIATDQAVQNWLLGQLRDEG